MLLTPWQQNVIISLRRESFAEHWARGSVWACGKSLIPTPVIRALLRKELIYEVARRRHVVVRLTKRGREYGDDLLNRRGKP